MEEKNTRKRVRFQLNTPNVLTLIRLVTIFPLAIMLAHWPVYREESFILFICIWLTDMLDGYIARKYDQITDFGKLFDPAVDKLFQATVAVMMAVVGQLPIWVPIFFVVRESLMILVALFLLRHRNIVVYSDIFGKISTFLYVVAFMILFWLPESPHYLRHVIFILPVLFSVIATLNYGYKNILKRRREASEDIKETE